jgi:hypothetical protein
MKSRHSRSAYARPLTVLGLALSLAGTLLPLSWHRFPPGTEAQVEELFLTLAGALCFGLAALVSVRGRSKRKLVATSVLSASFGLFLANTTLSSSFDNFGNRWLSFRLLSDCRLSLSGLDVDHPAYSLVEVGGRLLPNFPLGTGLLSVPIALPWKLAGLDLKDPARAEVFERQAAALMASAGVALFFLAVAQRVGSRAAIWLALLFGFGTPQWSCSSQGLWSSTGASFALSCLLLMVLRRGRGSIWVALAGGMGALVFFCRPSAVLQALALVPFVARKGRVSAAQFLTALGAGALAVMALQWTLYHHPLGGYGLLNEEVGFSLDGALEGLAGGLFSPSRGLIVFAPWLLLAVAIRVPPSVRELASLQRCAYFGSSLCLSLVATYGKWWGGYSLGPRLFADASPILVLCLLGLVSRRRHLGRATKGLITATVVGAVVLQALLTFRPIGWQWNALVDPDHNRDLLWSLRNSQLAAVTMPDWKYQPGPYRLDRAEKESDPTAVRIRVDLQSFANARYDKSLFPAPAGQTTGAAFPRLKSLEFDLPGALFQFLPAGRANAVLLSSALRDVTISLPSGRGASVALAVTGAGFSKSELSRSILEVEATYDDGVAVPHDLQLGKDIVPYEVEARRSWPPVSRTYAGRPQEPDVLPYLRIRLLPRKHDLVQLRFRLSPAVSSGSVALLALTVERPRPRTSS